MHKDKGALKLAIRAMTEMELYAKELSKRENMDISFSRTPAEITAQRFAVADLLNNKFKDKAMRVVKGDIERALSIINDTRDLPIYYTNGTHVPPNADLSLAERIKIISSSPLLTAVTSCIYSSVRVIRIQGVWRVLRLKLQRARKQDILHYNGLFIYKLLAAVTGERSRSCSIG